jgi:hypothetical protein
MLGSLQGGTDIWVRPGAKQSGWICTSQEWFEPGNLGTTQKNSWQYALFKAYTRERSWTVISDRLQKSYYLSRVYHDKNSKHRTDIRQYSFVNRTIHLWNQLPAYTEGILSCKPSNFRRRAKKAKNQVKLRFGGNHSNCSEDKFNKVTWNMVKRGEMWWRYEVYVAIENLKEGKDMVKYWWNCSFFAACLRYQLLLTLLLARWFSSPWWRRI